MESSMKTTKKLTRKEILRFSGVALAVPTLFGVLLFTSALTLNWPEAWIVVCAHYLNFIVSIFWGIHRNPDLVRERASNLKGSGKAWDQRIIRLHTLMMFSLLLVSGFDRRFGWSHVPLTIKLFAGVVLLVGYIIPHWVFRVNTYASGVVRIQEDRDHRVIKTGPYEYIRHPMYLGTIFMLIGFAIVFGSWWALIPAGLDVLLFVIRTALEDRTLRQELPGYEEYAKEVRFRLLPGIW
jgi:protein-S-isoprenylcysteine O-methyltransferase Ste14